MPKKNLLDRLAGAMKTLGKREGRALTPRQRVAAAQRWNSLADIGEDELFRLEKLSENASDRGPDFGRYLQADDDLRWMGVINGEGDVAANPFLSDNLDKYEEQSEFLDWCRYNGLEPNGRNLKQFRTAKIYDDVESGNLGAGDAVIHVFNAAGGFSPETGYDELEGLQSRMDSGNIGVLDAMDEAYLTGLRIARKRRGW